MANVILRPTEWVYACVCECSVFCAWLGNVVKDERCSQRYEKYQRKKLWSYLIDVRQCVKWYGSSLCANLHRLAYRIAKMHSERCTEFSHPRARTHTKTTRLNDFRRLSYYVNGRLDRLGWDERAHCGVVYWVRNGTWPWNWHHSIVRSVARSFSASNSFGEPIRTSSLAGLFLFILAATISKLKECELKFVFLVIGFPRVGAAKWIEVNRSQGSEWTLGEERNKFHNYRWRCCVISLGIRFRRSSWPQSAFSSAVFETNMQNKIIVFWRTQKVHGKNLYLW